MWCPPILVLFCSVTFGWLQSPHSRRVMLVSFGLWVSIFLSPNAGTKCLSLSQQPKGHWTEHCYDNHVATTTQGMSYWFIVGTKIQRLLLKMFPMLLKISNFCKSEQFIFFHLFIHFIYNNIWNIYIFYITRHNPAGTKQAHNVDIWLHFGCDVGWPKFHVNPTSNVNVKLMSNTDFSWRWDLVVFRLCNQNPTLSQRQIDVKYCNQNATSVWRHVQHQPDVT